MNDEDVSLSLPLVNLEECNIQDKAIEVDMFLVQGAVTREDMLPDLRQRIRTDHLNDKERRAMSI